ncbi:hypothetical protein [Thermoanaerobacter sp. A7A]|uniref:hypothetical protein n=1 Tax=Thermoanaerobacter sp. A7A TaxID=1350366 RepID=UPI00042462AA|nr:hypothetical protein [Thermoanaerobacter sp. A7A]
MNVNKVALKELLIKKFNGNYNKMAKALNVSPAQLYRILESNSNAGAKFLGKLIVYCKNNGIDYDKLILLPNALTEVNEKDQRQ